MPTWGNYHFFPLAFEQAGAGRAYDTLHFQNNAADVFDAQRDTPIWRFNLGGMKIHPSFIDSWDAFVDATMGQRDPFLFRIHGSRRFELVNQLIGTGNGVTTQFQLKKTRSYPYGPANESVEIVRFPWHDYPALPLPLGDGTTGQVILPSELVQISLNGVATASGWTCNRETGAVTFSVAPGVGVAVRASCKYFVLAHGQDVYPLQLDGVYTFQEGAELFQVPSEV